MLDKGWGRNHCHGAPPVCTNLAPSQSTGASSDADGPDRGHRDFLAVRLQPVDLQCKFRRTTEATPATQALLRPLMAYSMAYRSSLGQIAWVLPLAQPFISEAA